jgi:hypothetical protein
LRSTMVIPIFRLLKKFSYIVRDIFIFACSKQFRQE